MDRIIEVKVCGNHISKDNKYAGVSGEGNVTKLRITFDEGWDDYSKTVTFFDAHGNNPVKRIQGVDLIEDITKDARTYLTPIPPEPLAIAGELTFVVDGYFDGKRQRSIADKLVVRDSPITDDAGEPTDPTPSQAEQIQGEIEKIKGDIIGATIAKNDAETAKNLAVIAQQIAGEEKDAVLALRDETAEYTRNAYEHRVKAEESASKAEGAVFRYPVIDSISGNWLVWNANINGYVDSGIRAQAGSEVYVGNNPQPEADVWINPEGEATPITAYEIAVSQGFKGTEAEWVKSLQGKTPQKGVDYWNEEDKAEITEYIDDQTAIIKADVEGIQEDIKNEAHFRGYLSTNAKVRALQGTPNDYAYSAESGTKWVYDAENGWQDTGTPVPDQLTPASDTTPLINGVASVGKEEAYARGDHRHPTDTTRVSVVEFNSFKGDLETALDGIIAIQNSLLGGDSK